jgi:MtrB/PioB family decaheme-associated outer membrane protein
MMRNRTLILIGALLLVSPGAAWAQQQQPSAPPAATQTSPAPPAVTSESPKIGRIDFGFRGDSVEGDEARYQRFRDLRDGAFLDGFRLMKETETWLFRGEANNVGYRDQRYFAGFESIGKAKATFEWNQVPLFISKDSRSIWTDQGGGVLSIDDAIQQSIQNAGTNTALRSAAVTAAMAQATQVDLRSRRDNAAFDLVYTLNRDVDLKFNVRNSARSGNNIYAFGFGTSPGLYPAVEIGVPMDDRTTDVRGALEFANGKALLSVGYNGSWFDNQIPYVRFDNPLRAVDANNGPSVGGAVMWPSNTTFSVNANASYKFAPRTRASAAFSVGQASQDEQLAIATPNTALVAPSYARGTTQGKADIVSMVYSLTSRPVSNVSLNARYRYYDYNNKTPHWASSTIIGDWTANPNNIWENEPNSFKRKTLDLDASFSPMDYVSFAAGFGREDSDRTFRIFETTAENVVRLSVDSTGNQYVTLRAKYEYSKREGSHFEEHLLEEVGEQPDTRHFDVANRKRGRFTTSLVITPVSTFAFNVAASTGKDDYYESGFGLRDNKNTIYSVGFDVVPSDMVSFGLNYGRETYTAFQYSRTSNPLSPTNTTFLDPTRDWSIDSDDKVNTFTASLDLIKALPKTDIRLSYDMSDGKATYVYGGPAITNASVFPTVQLQPLAPVENTLTGAKADVQYFVRPNVALGLAYWYEDYQVKDFALGEGTIDKLAPTSASNGLVANTIYSGYLYRPYTAHTVWLRMSYLW